MKADVVNGWDVRPTLERIVAAKAAGSSVTGSSLPQALIQRRQRLSYELRLSTLVYSLSRPAPHPAAGDWAVAPPTTIPFIGLVPAPEPIGEMPPRHIPRQRSLRAVHFVLSGVVVCAWLPEPCPAATSGTGFTIARPYRASTRLKTCSASSTQFECRAPVTRICMST